MAKNKKARGTKTIYVFLPHIIIISVLYIFIIVSTVYLNKFTTLMSDNTQQTADSITIINEFQAQSSKLSASAINFAHTPIIVDSNGNKRLNERGGGPLDTYFNELADTDRSPEKTLKRLEKFTINETALKFVNTAIEKAKAMLDNQLHAFVLIDAGVREYSDLNGLDPQLHISSSDFDILTDDPEKLKLSAEEEALSYNEKWQAAENLLLDTKYSNLQNSVLVNSKLAVNAISEAQGAIQLDYNSRLIFARGFLWISLVIIIITTTVFFVILFRKLIFPIDDFAKRIDNNEKLDPNKGLYEANYLATAYNNLLVRHEEYDNLLKDVAETDSLTGLPNRYSLNKFLNHEIEESKSTCLFVLDINNLKYMNDTYGHDKGDELIKNASICIKDAFLDKTGKNCFRIGGDEFVVILDNISQTDIDKHLKIFNDKQKELNVSIAYGYSYSSNVKEYGYEKLMIEADKLMYENKEMIKNKEKSLNRDNIIYS